MPMPFQFPKPVHWNISANWITQTHDKDCLEYGYFTELQDAIEYLKDEGSYHEVEATLWQIIREPGQETRVVFRSYIPSVNVDWKE